MIIIGEAGIDAAEKFSSHGMGGGADGYTNKMMIGTVISEGVA